ncbi:MAG: NADH-quinone oxidoreductase subunit C [Nitrosopumilaceae archaeon]|uniref:NADH-quinone oxidoreductase subunit C n=1 Tax=Candidatus Nitrosomaritimum aestuariumsis TaxID=3342354 RepID=A0AC60W8C3_9ARCH|nr:NADH-quinone oxidoreductase subunit C [Nitrosopumilaceae archaeon]MBA4461759.1 NADH-quinone oxidoreductase subunit C [Nitrosopumilaceae archaeon]MBA4463635.1 NADH-quinone oxidoreductase subunit C [Nitrosopumilaceae archaeon]
MSSDSDKETIEKKPEESKPAETKTPEKPAVAKPAEEKPAASKPAPAKEEPELPAFEKGIADKIIEKFGEKTTISFVKPDRVGIKVGRDDIHDVAEFARDTLNYDHVDSVAGVDYPTDKEIEVVYHLSSYTDPTLSRQVLELATRAQREEDPIPGNDATKLPSLRDIFYSVEFHEREVFEMLGVYFEGHPDNRRLLLPEDWADLPPLRKDFRNKGR